MFRFMALVSFLCSVALVGVGAAGQKQTKPGPDGSYSCYIQKIDPTEDPEKNGVTKLIVKLDKAIPTNTGRIEIGGAAPAVPSKDAPKPIGSKATVFDIAAYQPDPNNRLAESDTIIVYFDNERAAKGEFKTVEDLKKMVKDAKEKDKKDKGIPAKIYLRGGRQ